MSIEINGKEIPGLTVMCGGATVKEEVLKEDLGARELWGVEELRSKCDEKEEGMGVYRSKERVEVTLFPRR